ncbi:MAG: hypothetical protein ACRDBG_18320, partial [Waterburya sp.]
MTLKCAYIGFPEDKEYLPHLKGFFKGIPTEILLQSKPIEYAIEVETWARSKNVTKIITSRKDLLQLLVSKLPGQPPKSASIDNYAGSVLYFSSKKDIEVIIINPLPQLFTVPYGKFLAERYISKATSKFGANLNGTSWPEPSVFNYSIISSPDQFSYCYERFRNADLIAVDIETFKENLCIRCVGYTAVYFNLNTSLDDNPGGINQYRTESIVFPINSEYNLEWARKFNNLPAAKITQNGKYDNAYFLRYGIPLHNWLWDTAHLFHSWYSELPKDLAFLNAFFLRDVYYWKDLAETTDLHEYYRYNCLDTWATANVFIQQINQMPEWAKKNYLLEFPRVCPCLLGEMTGVLRDS